MFSTYQRSKKTVAVLGPECLLWAQRLEDGALTHKRSDQIFKRFKRSLGLCALEQDKCDRGGFYVYLNQVYWVVLAIVFEFIFGWLLGMFGSAPKEDSQTCFVLNSPTKSAWKVFEKKSLPLNG